MQLVMMGGLLRTAVERESALRLRDPSANSNAQKLWNVEEDVVVRATESFYHEDAIAIYSSHGLLGFSQVPKLSGTKPYCVHSFNIDSCRTAGG